MAHWPTPTPIPSPQGGGGRIVPVAAFAPHPRCHPGESRDPVHAGVRARAQGAHSSASRQKHQLHRLLDPGFRRDDSLGVVATAVAEPVHSPHPHTLRPSLHLRMGPGLRRGDIVVVGVECRSRDAVYRSWQRSRTRGVRHGAAPRLLHRMAAATISDIDNHECGSFYAPAHSEDVQFPGPCSSASAT